MPQDNYFLSQPLSQKLVERVVINTMNFWYVRNEESDEWELVFGAGYGWSDFPCYGGYEYKVPAIHVFDLLLPENAKRVWGEEEDYTNEENTIFYTLWESKTKELLSLLQSNGDYEGYIKSTMIK